MEGTRGSGQAVSIRTAAFSDTGRPLRGMQRPGGPSPTRSPPAASPGVAQAGTGEEVALAQPARIRSTKHSVQAFGSTWPPRMTRLRQLRGTNSMSGLHGLAPRRPSSRRCFTAASRGRAAGAAPRWMARARPGSNRCMRMCSANNSSKEGPQASAPMRPPWPNTESLVATAQEREVLRGSKPWLGCLLFSAKEAVYKAQYTSNSRSLNFYDIELDRLPGAELCGVASSGCRSVLPRPFLCRKIYCRLRHGGHSCHGPVQHIQSG